MKNIKFKISNFNKYVIFLIVVLFLYLFYLSIPSLYKKGKLQKDLSDKLLSDFNINASFSADLNYSILPSPQILIKDAKIFNNDKKNPKELIQIKKMRIIISQKNLFSQDEIEIKKVIIEDANFLIQKNDFKFYNDFINKKFSSKKINIKNSNIFYKNFNNETILIFLIKDLNIFYKPKKFLNQIFLNGEVFKFPFNFKLNKKFTEKLDLNTTLALKDLNLKFENKSIKKNNLNYSRNELEIGSFKISSQYQFENDLLLIESLESKLLNNLLDYKAKVDFNPFYLKLDINLDKINLKKLIISNTIIQELFKTNIFFNKNISMNLSLNSNNVIRNKMFNSLNILFNIDNGNINFDNSYLTSNKIGVLKAYNSSLNLNDNVTLLKSNFNFIITNQKEFYKSFLVPKKNRKILNNIYFTIQYDFLNKKLKITNFRVNEKKDSTKLDAQRILDEFNNEQSSGIKNWIDFKKFTNQLLEGQSG